MTEHRTKGEYPITYEVDGPADGPAIMMLNGIGLQLTQWPQAFLDSLHAAGLRTVRVDNRDIGKSARAEGKRAPNPMLQMGLGLFGISAGAPYSLSDMADDAISVLDDLGIEKAHVLGLSMGGIISQVLAGRFPERVKSVVLFMTTTGNKRLPLPSGETRKILMSRGPAPTSKEEAIDQLVARWNHIKTQDGGMSEEELREFHSAAIDRGMDRQGFARQFAAILESGDVREHTRRIKAPTLIIHGIADPLVPVTGGKDIHANIPGSRIELIDGMGHDLPAKHVKRFSELVVGHCLGASAD